jgi:uncharacterized membrane protein
MRTRQTLSAAFLVLLAACGSGGPDPVEPGDGSAGVARDERADPPDAVSSSADEAGDGSANWDLSAGERGITLALLSGSGPPVLRFFCPSGQDELQLHVSPFRPVGSEERMTFGSGGTVHALVADPESHGGGVRASGRVPGYLAALIAGPVSVNYGSQNSGPHAGPAASAVRRFASACRAEVPAHDGDNQGNGDGSVSACLIQDGNRLRNPPLRAIGTEPFWNARTNGRCVTYSHPEDQDGTHVWTTYKAGPDGSGTWSGALGDRLFELTIRPRPRCSDGMSDRRYPFEAELKVQGEVRRGCAEPAQSSR